VVVAEYMLVKEKSVISSMVSFLVYVCFVASQLNSASICVRALHYSSLLGGFAVVLSNGRAAFLTANSLKFEPSVSYITFCIIVNSKDVCCVDAHCTMELNVQA